MHAFVEDRDDADCAVAEDLPVDEVFRVAANVTFDFELCRDGAPGEFAGGDCFEFVE